METTTATPNAPATPEATKVDTGEITPDKLASKPEKPKAPVEKKKYKVKVDKDEIEVDEDELVSSYQIRKASDKRFNEAASLRKQNEEFVALLKDPDRAWEVLEKLGHDPKTLAEKRLAAALEDELLTDAEKALRKREKDLEAREKKLNEADENKKKTEYETVKKQLATEYETKIVEALEGSDLPKTAGSVKRIAQQMALQRQRGLPHEPKDVLKLVRQDLLDEQKSLVSAMSAEDLIKYFGEEVATKIRTHDIGKLKNPKVPFETTQNTQQTTSVPKVEKKIGMEEWREQMAQQLKRFNATGQ